MAEKVLITRTGRTKIGIESAFGTLAGTMVDIFPDAGGLLDLKQEQLKMRDERPTKTAHQQNVQGQKSWGGKLGFKLRPPALQLTSLASPATPPQMVATKALWGGEQKAAGSTVASSADTSTITVASGHGSRFPVGTWAAVVISGVPVPFKVVAVDADELTVFPALPSTPSTSAVVYNSCTYYPTQSNTQSISVQHAKPNAANGSDYDQQWEARGGTGDLGFEMKTGQVPMCSFDLRGAPWSGPDSAPGLLPAPFAEDTQGAPFVFNNATVLWQPVDTTTRVHTPIAGVDFKFDGQMMHLEDPGGVEGKIGVERVGSEFMMVSGTIAKRFDATFDGYYSPSTPLWFCAMIPLGSGTSKRWAVVEVSTMFLAQKPGLADDGGMTRHQHEWEGLEDQTIADPATDLARAPFRLALI